MHFRVALKVRKVKLENVPNFDLLELNRLMLTVIY